MIFVYDWAITLAAVTTGLILTFSCVRIFELVAPRTSFDAASQLRSLRFWPYYITVMVACESGLSAFNNAMSIQPLISIDGKTLYQATGLGPVNYLVWPVVTLIVVDFFHYWKHRIEHKFFWRFHSIHHSIQNLSAVNSYHHWSDPIISTTFASIPMMIIIGFDTPTFLALSLLIAAQGPFIHSNTKIHFGLLNRLFVDNRFHRIHHSIEHRHVGKNFGERVTIWDQLFGTAHFPCPNEWPNTGVTEQREPVRTGDYFWRPFRRLETLSSATV